MHAGAVHDVRRGHLLAKSLVAPVIVGLVHGLTRLVVDHDPKDAAYGFLLIATTVLLLGLLVTRRTLYLRSVEFGEHDIVLHGRRHSKQVPYSEVTLVGRRWFGVPAVWLFSGETLLAAVPSSLKGMSRRQIVEQIEIGRGAAARGRE